MYLRFLLLSAFSLSTLVALSAPAFAQKTWDGGAGTDQWTDGDNWSPNGVPMATDDVQLDGGAVVVLNTSTTIGGLTIRDSGTSLTIGSGHLLTTGAFSLANGTVSGDGALTADSLSFTVGTIEGSGTVTVTGGAFISGTSFARNLIGRTLRLEGTTVVAGGNPLRMGDAARIEVPSGAVFDIQSDGDIVRTGTITTLPVIAVEAGGAFVKSAVAGVSLIRAVIANAGTVAAEAGTLQFGDGFGESGGTSTGAFSVAAGATLDFDDGLFDFTTADFSGAGTVDFGRVGAVTLTGTYDLATGTTRLSGGAGDGVTFAAGMTLQSLGQTIEVAGQATATLDLAPLTMPATVDLSGGQAALLLAEALDVETLLLRIGSCRLGGSGDVTTDSLSFTGGFIEGSGVVTVTGDALISGTSFSRNVIGRTLRLEGTTVVSGGNPLRMGDAARVEVPSGAAFDIQSDGNIRLTGTITTLPEIEIETGGRLVKSAGLGVTEIEPDIQNSGTLDLAVGEILLEGAFTNTTAGVVKGNGTLDLTGTTGFSNSGAFAPGASPGRLTVQGTWVNSTLAIELGGLVPGTEHDQLAVEGDAFLAGTLDLRLIVGYAPSVGDSYTILTATGAVTDSFATVNMPFGYAFDLTYGATSVVATVTSVPDYDLVATNTTSLTAPAGGQVSFSYSITNNTALPVTGDFWYTAAPGNVSGLILNDGTLAAGQTVTSSFTQNIPLNAPPGTYTYTLRIGQFPSPTLDSEVFTLTVTAAPRQSGRDREAQGEEAIWTVTDVAPWVDPGGAVVARASDATPDTPRAATAAATPAAPEQVVLEAAYPNPFRRATTLRYGLPTATAVRLAVYDVQGRVVARLVEAQQPAGWHTATLDALRLPSGLYFIRLDTGDRIHTRPVTLVR